jgi:hypothetical protein
MRNLVISLLWLIMSLGVWGDIILPFTDDFESGTNNIDYINEYWHYKFIPPRASSEKVKTGTLSLYSPDSSTLKIQAERLWFEMWVRVNPVNLAEASQTTNINTDAAAFFIDILGNIHAWSNNAYVVISTGLNTNHWHNFAIQLDYLNHTWNLFYKNQNAAFTTPYVKLNPTPLAFNYLFNAESSSEIEISGETYLDDVHVKINTFAIHSMKQFLRRTNIVNNIAGTGIDFRCIGNQGILNGELGMALESILNPGDQVYVWNNISSNFMIATSEENGFSGTSNLLNHIIKPTTGIFIKREKNKVQKTTGFVTYDEIYSHKTAEPTIIYPSWNLLTVPFTAGTRNLSSLNLPTSINDGIFVWNTNGWRISRFDGTKWVVDFPVPAGRTFWYVYRGKTERVWPNLN